MGLRGSGWRGQSLGFEALKIFLEKKVFYF